MADSVTRVKRGGSDGLHCVHCGRRPSIEADRGDGLKRLVCPCGKSYALETVRRVVISREQFDALVKASARTQVGPPSRPRVE